MPYSGKSTLALVRGPYRLSAPAAAVRLVRPAPVAPGGAVLQP